MSASVYINCTEIGSETGDGVVGANELAALSEVSDVQLVLDAHKLRPDIYKQPYSPFLQDVFARGLIQKSGLSYNLCHIYGNPYGTTVDFLQHQGCRVVVTYLAHDSELSIKLHEELAGVGTYPFWHVKNRELGFWMLTEHVRLADRVITPSTYSKKVIMKEIGINEKKIVLVPHGTTIPRDNEIHPVPSGFVVGFLSQAGADKDLVSLIRAWSELGYNDAELIIAGAGTENLEPLVKHFAERGKFRLVGRVPKASDLYNACSVFVLPSANEAFGMTLIEAMAHRRAVITTSGCGASDAVTNGVDGFVVEPRNSHQLATKIAWMRDNMDEAKIMGQNAREKARQRYDWQLIREEYKKVYSDLLLGERKND